MSATITAAARAAISQQLIAARQSQQRRLVVLSGPQTWAQALLLSIPEWSQFNRPLWLADKAPEGINTVSRQAARQWLGQEIDLLVYDAWAGFDPEALAATAGALVAGGLLVLLTPALPQWPAFNDPDYQRLLVHPFTADCIAGRFLQHIVNSLADARHCLQIEPQRPPVLINIHADTVAPEVSASPDHGCKTAAQAAAVSAIQSVVSGHRRRPLVMTSDRGRGKSAALGIASARLMQQRDCRILITAPRSASVAVVFALAAEQLQQAEHNRCLQWQQSTLQFIAPDELAHYDGQADLVLVDEAAAIPAALLERYLRRFSRIVFATTVHGYEGTGRGFAVRFKQTLDQLTPQWRALSLQQPIRWAANDPVERWLFDALLLNASPATAEQFAGSEKVTGSVPAVSQYVTEKLHRDQLLSDPELLRELFGLLVLAHYQTTPSDLRILLDGLNISVWVSRCRGHVVAAALVADEGGFDEALGQQVWCGRRRPHGHLLPQALSAHGGLLSATALRYQRIVRIAVHPALQRKSLGRQLMRAIIANARAEQVDGVGSSFAATADVLAFWHSLSFVPVLLGVSRDASSGCHSVQVLCSLSAGGDELLALARRRFSQQFPRNIMLLYPQLETAVIAQLLSGIDTEPLCQQDWLDSEAFAEGFRPFDLCIWPLWKLVCWGFSRPPVYAALSAMQQQLLIRRVLQQQPIKTVADALQLSGKKQLQLALREAFAALRQVLITTPDDTEPPT